jgi:hypothetical protein
VQCFSGQQPRCPANAGRDALPQAVAVKACFASLAAGRVSAGVCAHSRAAERCSVEEETSFGSGQPASDAFASTRWTVTGAADY